MLLAALMALAVSDPTAEALDLIGPTHEGPAYICPGPMAINRVIQSATSSPEPDEVAKRFQAALKTEKCYRVTGRFQIVHAFDFQEVNQGAGPEIWFQLTLRNTKGQILYGLIGVSTD